MIHVGEFLRNSHQAGQVNAELRYDLIKFE
jgi:hypothetical protein